MNTGITEASYTRILKVLDKFPEIESARIFGSRAKGNFKAGSDIDIVIYGHDCTDQTSMQLKAVLNEQEPIPYFVDVINYRTITNADLKDHIDRVSIVLYER